jgi:hypothetical protein
MGRDNESDDFDPSSYDFPYAVKTMVAAMEPAHVGPLEILERTYNQTAELASKNLRGLVEFYREEIALGITSQERFLMQKVQGAIDRVSGLSSLDTVEWDPSDIPLSCAKVLGIVVLRQDQRSLTLTPNGEKQVALRKKLLSN